jgi:hypothetical protein
MLVEGVLVVFAAALRRRDPGDYSQHATNPLRFNARQPPKSVRLLDGNEMTVTTAGLETLFVSDVGRM